MSPQVEHPRHAKSPEKGHDNDDLSQYARRLSYEHSGGEDHQSRTSKAATEFVKHERENHKLISEGKVPPLDIVGGHVSLVGRDSSGHYWNISQDKQGRLHAKRAESEDSDSSGGSVGDAKRNKNYNAFVGEPDGSGGTDKEGKHYDTTYGVSHNGWQTAREILEAQRQKAGMSDSAVTNTDIANYERKLAKENGFTGKHAVDDWAKSLKAGGEVKVAGQDLRGPGLDKAVENSTTVNTFHGPAAPEKAGNASPVPGSKPGNLTEVEHGKLNDSKFHDLTFGLFDNKLDFRTPYTKAVVRDEDDNIKSSTTIYKGDGTTVSGIKGADGQPVELANVRAQYAFKAQNGQSRIRYTIVGGADRWAHINNDGEIELDK
ncbi:MAG TPA: hypothetical protein V6C89_00380 [Drouetiella sp.]|jgi:hypothetical protein